MKKKLLLICLLISTIGFSQQVLKKVTPTQISFIALGNGSSILNTCGNNNIDVGNSEEGGSVVFRLPNASSSVGTTASLYNSVVIQSETIGNTIFSNWIGSQQNIWSTIANPDVSLSLIRKRARIDCNGDNGFDAIIDIWDLPFTQTTGASIPNGMKLRIATPTLQNLYTGSTLLPTGGGWFEWQNNNWVQNLTSPNGAIMPIYEDWGQFLNLENLKEHNNFSISPNPTNGNISIYSEKISIENFEFKIIDLIGRIVQKGTSKFNEQINI